MKELKDILHLYLECDVMTPDGIRPLIGIGILGLVYVRTFPPKIAPSTAYFTYHASVIKLALRPLSDLSAEDFYSFNQPETEKDILITDTINNRWCAGLYDKKEYAGREKEELCTDPVELLYDLEEADHTNVLSCDKDGTIAYGLDDGFRYFVDLPTQAAWINHLRKRGFDCDKLIENGLAIDKNTLK